MPNNPFNSFNSSNSFTSFNSPPAPFFSVCIPQHNRTSFLLKMLASFRRQTFPNFEICISDGASDDGRHAEIVSFLEQSNLSFRYYRSPERLRYDPNLRSCIRLARGRYCLLFGNDDMPAAPTTLQLLHDSLAHYSFPEVLIPNYLDLPTAKSVRRIRRTGILGAGPSAAIAHFRDFSFVSGILLSRPLAQTFATDKWDGSEMYQMYLGCRILSHGGRLLGLDHVAVHKNIQIPGQLVESYASRPIIKNCPIHERKLPLTLYVQVALDATFPNPDTTTPSIHPSITPPIHQSTNPSIRRHLTPDPELSRHARAIFQQALLYTYPPWLVEYRKVQSWRYAAGIALGMRPRNQMGPLAHRLTWTTRAWIRFLYAAGTIAGLLVPISLFRCLKPALYAAAKRTRTSPTHA